MTHSVIVENVSKEYKLGEAEQFGMLRDTLVRLLRNPFRSDKKGGTRIWALRDVSLSVKTGEVVGIIGRNGAGKSTLLKLLARITSPTSGAVKVTGRVASLLEVGTGFHEELTGRENIMLNGSILGMQRSEVAKHMDAIIEFAGVAKFIDTPIKRYSSGMRLRLGFAVAAHLDPDILIIDEVLAVGDAGFQKKCLGVMEGLRSSGRTVLFVSHNMSAVENLCERVIWIDQGTVRQDGEPRTVIGAYMDSFGEGKQARFDLAASNDRTGNGYVRLTSVEYLGFDRKPVKVVRSGGAYIIRLHYSVKNRASHPTFVVRIYSILGTLVTEMNSWMTDYEIPFLDPGSGYIDLEIDFLNLMPGRYLLSLEVGAMGLCYDRINYCGHLDIEPSDYYGSGRGIDSRYGLVFMPMKWNLVTAPCVSETVSER
jgi:lipopolysaccharide transport system ATP-binding protein